MKTVIDTMAILMAVVLLISIGLTIASAFLYPSLVPDWDMHHCPPITTNPKRIWAYWRKGPDDMTMFVRETIRMWKHTAPEWEIRILQSSDPTTECYMGNFLPPELLPKSFDNMTAQLSSDSIRLAAVRKYGGVYLDSTIILLQDLETHFWNRLNLPEGDPNKTAMAGHYQDYISLPGTNNGYELWFLCALPEEPIIVAWHDKFLKIMEHSPTPFMRNETTKELNPLLYGTELSHFRKYDINYLYATAALQATLKQNPILWDRYANHSQITNALLTAYRANNIYNFDPHRLYDLYVNPHKVSIQAQNDIYNGVPLIKFVQHAFWFSDESYSKWRNLYSNLGYVRRKIADKSNLWWKGF
jgi:hypothetical protein